MAIPSDQLLAQYLLESRKCGLSYGRFLQRSASKYVLLIALFAALFVVLAVLQIWILNYVLLGMFVGCLARDFGWVRNSRKLWPFHVKVMDWKKIEAVARGEAVSQSGNRTPRLPWRRRSGGAASSERTMRAQLPRVQRTSGTVVASAPGRVHSMGNESCHQVPFEPSSTSSPASRRARLCN